MYPLLPDRWAHLPAAAMEQLASLVTKLIASDLSLDLKRWTIGVDLTADRAGFVLANDLAVALAVIKATPDEQTAVPQADRIREPSGCGPARWCLPDGTARHDHPPQRRTGLWSPPIVTDHQRYRTPAPP